MEAAVWAGVAMARLMRATSTWNTWERREVDMKISCYLQLLTSE